MTYFECRECGQLVDLVGVERSRVHDECPVCEERTVWEVAFDDPEGGVSY